MSFFEAEFPRKGLAFQRLGGPAFSTFVVGVESGNEQRNRNWNNARREYSGGVIATTDDQLASVVALIDSVQTFFLLVGGRADAFRFFDELDYQATGEVMGATSDPTVWQLQRTYSLGGRSYVRTITKPITSSVLDYRGNPLSDTVTPHASGVSVVSIDHTTGLVAFSGSPGGSPAVAPTADFQYHISVRFNSDKFEPQIEVSAPGTRLIKWNSLSLIEVRPPNY